MADAPAQPIFPPLKQVRICLREDFLDRFEAFVREAGWLVEDATRILLAYPAVVAMGSTLSPEGVRDELGAARGELATLRHRAFMADDTIRTLKMNVAGFAAALQQFEKLLPELEREEASLRTRLATLGAEAASRGIEVEPDDPEPVPPQRSLFDFFRRHSGNPPDRD